MFMKNAFKVLIIGLIAFALATVTYAYAAANTVPATMAGDGSGAITGYTVTNIAYVLNAGNPANLDKVNFTLSAAASVVDVSVNGVAPYTACTIVSGNNWTCSITGTTVLSATSLRIIATQ